MLKKTVSSLKAELKKFPSHWDGKKSILEMKNNGSQQWKQMEWIGFYFEFLCNNKLSKILDMPGPRFGNVEFDGYRDIPWDFKAHANQSSKYVIVNDSEAVSHFIEKEDNVGLILASGDATYNDENLSFKIWHDKLKGGKSEYELKRIKRGASSRLRKTEFDLERIDILLLDDKTLMNSGTFQKNFRNSNGKPRRAKLKINLKKIRQEIVKTRYF